MKIWNLLRIIQTVCLSRVKKTKTEQWIKDRRKICYVCPYNTRNLDKISFKQKVSRFFSNCLTLIMTGRLNEDNSECSICTCTLTYKTKSEYEGCNHPVEDQWKSIYLPNSAQKEKWKKI